MESRSPLVAEELLRKLQLGGQHEQQHGDHNHNNRQLDLPSTELFLEREIPPSRSQARNPSSSSSCVAVLPFSRRRVTWQDTTNVDRRLEPEPPTKVDGELKSLQDFLSESALSALNGVDEDRCVAPSLEFSGESCMRPIETTTTVRTRDANISSWMVADDQIAELERKIQRIHQTMAKLENETADLNQQADKLKEATQGLRKTRVQRTSTNSRDDDSNLGNNSHSEIREYPIVVAEAGPKQQLVPIQTCVDTDDGRRQQDQSSTTDSGSYTTTSLESRSAEIIKINRHNRDPLHGARRWNGNDDSDDDEDDDVLLGEDIAGCSPRSEVLPRRPKETVSRPRSSSSLPSFRRLPPVPSGRKFFSSTTASSSTTTTSMIGPRRSLGYKIW